MDVVEMNSDDEFERAAPKRRRQIANVLANLDNFAVFAKELAAPDLDLLEPLSVNQLVSEINLVCLGALGAAPPAVLIREAVLPIVDRVWVEPTNVFALTLARTSSFCALLGHVLAKRVRVFLHATWRSERDTPELGPAPGEQPWELVQALLEAKARSRMQSGFTTATSLFSTPGARHLGKDSDAEDRFFVFF